MKPTFLYPILANKIMQNEAVSSVVKKCRQLRLKNIKNYNGKMIVFGDQPFSRREEKESLFHITKPKHMNKLLMSVCAALILVACSSEAEEPSQSTPTKTALDAYTLTPEEANYSFTVPGTIMAAESVELYSEVSGRVDRIYFKEGDRVKKGELLMKMDSDILNAELQELKAQLSLAEKEEKRKGALYENKALSLEDYEQAQNNLAVLNARKDLLEVQISKTQIRAPFNGRVGLRRVSEGAFLTPSTLITSIVQDDQLKVEFSVSERFVSKLDKDQEVMLGGEGAESTAKIYAFAPSIDQQTRMLTVRAWCDNNENLYPGGFTPVHLELGRDTNAFMVPNAAVSPVMEGQMVWKVVDGKAHSVMVETGVREEDKVQIFGDLKVGDQVITTGLLGLREGSEVNVKSEK